MVVTADSTGREVEGSLSKKFEQEEHNMAEINPMIYNFFIFTYSALNYNSKFKPNINDLVGGVSV